MAKFNSKLSKREIGTIFNQFCVAISEINDPKEAAVFLQDLLSYQEASMIAMRLKIAEFLIAGESYEDIREKIKVGYGTIARVQEWLKISGEGYRKAVGSRKFRAAGSENNSRSVDDDFSPHGNLKRRYPMYYWPELVLESIVKNSNEKQKKKIRDVIDQMDKMKQKTELYKKLKKLVNYK